MMIEFNIQAAMSGAVMGALTYIAAHCLGVEVGLAFAVFAIVSVLIARIE